MDVKRPKLYDLLMPADPDELVTKSYLDLRLAESQAAQTDKLTWRMITIMGAWTAIGTSLFALMSKLVIR